MMVEKKKNYWHQKRTRWTKTVMRLKLSDTDFKTTLSDTSVYSEYLRNSTCNKKWVDIAEEAHFRNIYIT